MRRWRISRTLPHKNIKSKLKGKSYFIWQYWENKYCNWNFLYSGRPTEVKKTRECGLESCTGRTCQKVGLIRARNRTSSLPRIGHALWLPCPIVIKFFSCTCYNALCFCFSIQLNLQDNLKTILLLPHFKAMKLARYSYSVLSIRLF